MTQGIPFASDITPNSVFIDSKTQRTSSISDTIPNPVLDINMIQEIFSSPLTNPNFALDNSMAQGKPTSNASRSTTFGISCATAPSPELPSAVQASAELVKSSDPYAPSTSSENSENSASFQTPISLEVDHITAYDTTGYMARDFATMEQRRISISLDAEETECTFCSPSLVESTETYHATDQKTREEIRKEKCREKIERIIQEFEKGEEELGKKREETRRNARFSSVFRSYGKRAIDGFRGAFKSTLDRVGKIRVRSS